MITGRKYSIDIAEANAIGAVVTESIHRIQSRLQSPIFFTTQPIEIIPLVFFEDEEGRIFDVC